jgi:hypothetical protein
MTAEQGATLDDLHLAMGRFLTESSEVEGMMGSLVQLGRGNRTMEETFIDYMGKTFGQKISAFKDACDAHAFSDAHRAILNEVYIALDELLPKRNFIVHGHTYQLGALENVPAQPYRIGMQRGDGDFLSKAIANGKCEGPHVFTAAGVAAVSEEFLAVRAKLGAVSVEVFTALARKK